MERDLNWYKTAKRGDTYYDVCNTIALQMTYIGYYIDEQNVSWVVSTSGICKLTDNMFPESEYHEMIKKMRNDYQTKLGNKIKVLERKLELLEQKLKKSGDYNKFMEKVQVLDDGTEQPFASIPEFAMELAANAIETNLK